MRADLEWRLLARARELADLSGLRADTQACLGAARHAGLDPQATAGLTGCALALGATSRAAYTADAGWTAAHADQHHFLAHVDDIDAYLAGHLRGVIRLGRDAAAALDAARQDLADAQGQLADGCAQLAAARALPTGRPCDGCHAARAAAISAAEAAVQAAADSVRECETRISIGEDITSFAEDLMRRLRHAQARIRAVPADLAETYQPVYVLIGRGGALPRDGRWLTGTSPAR